MLFIQTKDAEDGKHKKRPTKRKTGTIMRIKAMAWRLTKCNPKWFFY